MTYTAGRYSIGIDVKDNTYLPAGNYQTGVQFNHLPATCNKFVYLKVMADLSVVGGTDDHTVYVPCYFTTA